MLPLRDHLPTRSPAVVNYLLIAANIVVFGLEASGVIAVSPDGRSIAGALVPAALVAHPFASLPTLVSHMFLHAGIGHVGGNMLFLWIFGDNVEDALGSIRYLLFYLACGVAGALVQVALDPHATVPLIGASGAISGVLGAYILLYPTSPITVINPIPLMWLFWGLFISLPAWLVLIEWFAGNLWGVLRPSQPQNAGGVAFAAHVGGFVAGLILSRLLRMRAGVDYQPWQRLLPESRRFGARPHRSARER
ncbi:MAG: rhomboid family intramembrane serine protease [Pseudomonadota bacterium]